MVQGESHSLELEGPIFHLLTVGSMQCLNSVLNVNALASRRFQPGEGPFSVTVITNLRLIFISSSSESYSH